MSMVPDQAVVTSAVTLADITDVRMLPVDYLGNPMQDNECKTVAPGQAVVTSARTLADITDERVVPVDYLGVLILLFMALVLDRLFYTLGLHLGKVRSSFPLNSICCRRYSEYGDFPRLRNGSGLARPISAQPTPPNFIFAITQL